MTIIVTGAAGFIGHALTRALMQRLDQWSALPRLRPVIDYWNLT